MRRPERQCPIFSRARFVPRAPLGTTNLNAVNEPDGLSRCPTPRDWDNGTDVLGVRWFCGLLMPKQSALWG